MKRSKRILKWAMAGLGALVVSAGLFFAVGYASYEFKSLSRTAGAPDALKSVDPHGLEYVLEQANRSHSDAIVIIKNGELIGAWHAGSNNKPIEAMSATKSIVNLAVGRAKQLGFIQSLDEPVYNYFPEWDKPSHRQITTRHIMSHSSGLECLSDTSAIYAQDDFVEYALQAEPISPPGQHFQYNNRLTNLLPAIIEKATGQPLDEFLRKDLFAKLGISNFAWVKDRAGNPHGMAGLQILPEDLAKIGMLVLDRGRVAADQLIEDGWFTESFAPTPSLPAKHGLLWWLHSDGGELEFVKADGFLGQYLVIYPSERIVGVRMYRAGFAHGFTYDDNIDGYGDFGTDLKRLIE